ncbi:phage tail assembly protein T [Ralstonia sp. 25C]|uniref:phage tail assembly protein T n=1 Tax=Ralstonia sp. 25C TaxID=3447363 RepID=UPI003F74D1D4
MTVKQLLSVIDSAELTEWAAFDRLEPFGETRADLRAGIVAAATANHSYARPDTPYKASDFMPFLKRDDDKPVLLQDPEQQSKLILSQVFLKD